MPLAVLAILLAGALAYSNSFAGVFVLDDEPAIVQNPHIRSLSPLAGALGAPEGTTASGRPAVSLTLALNHALAPDPVRDVFSVPVRDASDADRARLLDNLWGYHALNLAIHLAAALALLGVTRRTLASGMLRDRFESHAGNLSLAVALLWTVHPLLTGAVTYVIQRAESLMGLCLMLTLYGAIRAWSSPRTWSLAAVAACALGMASKETMVAAPLVVALWDWTFGPRPFPIARRLPLYAGLAATWLILAWLVAGNHRPDAAGFGFAAWPWWRYLVTQAAVITHYLRLALVPFPLVLDYGWPAADVLTVLPQLTLISALVVVTTIAVMRRWPSGFAGGAFFLILAPSSSVLPIVTEVAAEHRMYVPLAALIALLAIGGYEWLRARTPARAGRIGLAATLVLATAGAGLTYARNADYHDADRLWLDTIARRPGNARARNNYATALLEERRFQEAETQARAAVDAEPRSVEGQQTLGVSLCAQDRCAEGLPHLEAAVALAPALPDVQRNLAEAYASLGRMTDAVAHYQRALDVRPDDLLLLNRAGWILATDAGAARDGARAVVLAEHAVRLSSRQDVESLDTLAAAYAETGRFDEAVAVATEALRLAPARQPAIVPELQQRLTLYEGRGRFRQ